MCIEELEQLQRRDHSGWKMPGNTPLRRMSAGWAHQNCKTAGLQHVSTSEEEISGAHGLQGCSKRPVLQLWEVSLTEAKLIATMIKSHSNYQEKWWTFPLSGHNSCQMTTFGKTQGTDLNVSGWHLTSNVVESQARWSNGILWKTTCVYSSLPDKSQTMHLPTFWKPTPGDHTKLSCPTWHKGYKSPSAHPADQLKEPTQRTALNISKMPLVQFSGIQKLLEEDRYLRLSVCRTTHLKYEDNKQNLTYIKSCLNVSILK